MKKIVEIAIKYPWQVIIFIALLTAIAGYFAIGVPVEDDIMKILPEHDPQVKLFNDIGKRFGGTDYFLVVIEGENVFSHSTLEKVKGITDKLETLPELNRVESITNVDDIKAHHGELDISKFMEHIPDDTQTLERLKQQALSNKLYVGNLVSPNGKVLAILCQIKKDINSKLLVNKIDKLIEPYKGPENIYLIGVPVDNDIISKAIHKDLRRLLPFAILINIIIMYILFRNFISVVLRLTPALIAIVLTVGAMGITHTPFTMLSVGMPTLLIALGSIYSIHIMTRYYQLLDHTKNNEKALKGMIRELGMPMLFIGLITSMGFFANISSTLTEVRQAGMFAGIGILFSMFVSVTLVPALLTIRHKGREEQISERSGKFNQFLEKLSEWVQRHNYLVLVVGFGLALIAIYRVRTINTETDITKFFKPNSPVRITSAKAVKDFGGIFVLQILVKGDITSPSVMKTMADVENVLSNINGVHYPFSIADLIEKMNQVMHDNEPAYYSIPDNKNAIAQYLLLYSMSDQKLLDSLITPDSKEAIIQVRIGKFGFHEIEQIVNQIKERLKPFESKDIQFVLTGSPMLILTINRHLIENQETSLYISIIAVFLLLSIVFRSLVGGLITLIPLLIKVSYNYGIMELFNIPLNVATALIASMTIGVGVDYIIHFVMGFRERFKSGSHNLDTAMKEATVITGRSIINSAIVLVGDFSVLTMSSFLPMIYFGILSASMVIYSSIVSITLFPALLQVTHKHLKWLKK
ncbi:MAG: efflux RND transporter permease subunit [bacterium]